IIAHLAPELGIDLARILPQLLEELGGKLGDRGDRYVHASNGPGLQVDDAALDRHVIAAEPQGDLSIGRPEGDRGPIRPKAWSNRGDRGANGNLTVHSGDRLAGNRDLETAVRATGS